MLRSDSVLGRYSNSAGCASMVLDDTRVGVPKVIDLTNDFNLLVLMAS